MFCSCLSNRLLQISLIRERVAANPSSIQFPKPEPRLRTLVKRCVEKESVVLGSAIWGKWSISSTNQSAGNYSRQTIGTQLGLHGTVRFRICQHPRKCSLAADYTHAVHWGLVTRRAALANRGLRSGAETFGGRRNNSFFFGKTFACTKKEKRTSSTKFGGKYIFRITSAPLVGSWSPKLCAQITEAFLVVISQ